MLKKLFIGLLLSGTISLFAADAPATFEAGPLKFTRPAKWQWVEVAPGMRAAQLKITDEKKKGDSAEVVFFAFGAGSGGSPQANVDRWLSQFEEPKEKTKSKVETKTLKKGKVTYVQAEGTYKSGMPGGSTTPMKNTMLLGAILESNDGNVFVKCTGPTALVKASADDFKKMVEEPLKK